MSGFFFGPLGAMIPMEVSAGVQVESGRALSELVTSGGVRYAQQGRNAPRTWTVGRLWQEPAWARLLTAAAHGLLGDVWLYDVAAARENMVPASLASGSGIRLPTDGLPLGSHAAGHTVTVPVLAGRLYTVSAWAGGSAGANVMSFKLGTGATEFVKSPPGTGHRQATGTIRTPSDGLLTVTLLAIGMTGLRVHDGPPDGRFYAGHGTPCKVAIQDPERTLQLVSEDTTRSDYQVTLLEVGKPGTI